MEILLVIPKYNLTNKKNYEYQFPLGLGYISSVIKKAGYSLDCINLNHKEGFIEDLIVKALDDKKYDIVCSGNIGTGYAVLEKIILAVKKHQSKPKFILGGAIVTSAPKLIFDSLNPDYAIIGEGEVTILELLKCLKEGEEVKNVNGIIYRNSDDKSIINSPREPIDNLDSIPLPDFDGLEFNEFLENQAASANSSFDYPKSYPILCSRGCPFHCTFCYHSLGTKYRTRSIDEVIKELDWAIKKYKINFIAIYDDLFSLNKDRLYDFCKKIKLLFKEISWKCEWACQLSVQNVDEEMMSIIKDAGCTGVSWGFESYSPIVLKSMKKPITPQEIDKAIKLSMKFQINLRGNFIFGDIVETKETAQTTLKYWEENCNGQVSISFIQPYPGSEIYNHCVKKGIIKDELDHIKNRMASDIWLNMTNNMTDKEISELKKKISKLRAKKCKYVIPIKTIKENKSKHYLFQIKCPFCGEKFIYKNCYARNIWHYSVDIYCRKCHMNFSICSRLFKFGMDYYNELYFLRKNILFIRNILLKRKV